MDKCMIVGRALAQLDYNTFVSILEKAFPMLTDGKHIQDIFLSIEDLHSDEEDYMRKLLFVAVVYDCYCPGAFFSKIIMKMPAGIRDEASRCMGYENPEMVNYFIDRAKPFLKFRDKAFGRKVENIKEMFKQYSQLEADWVLKLK